MKFWLKILCVILVLYSCIFSLWHPMIPGGFAVNAKELHPGINQFGFVGYNTHFITDRQNLQVLVSSGSKETYYCAEILDTPSENYLIAQVTLPDTVASLEFSFYANTLTDGTVFVEAPTTSSGFVVDKNTRAGACSFKVTSDAHSKFGFPYQPIIIESIRNLMWHVPMWFTMFVLMGISIYFSVKSISVTGPEAGQILKKIINHDMKASAAANAGMLFCTLGLITGSVWARFTWGTWWVNDPQLNGALVVFIIYAAYFILRSTITDSAMRARISAIFNIFAFALMVVLLMVMPRFAEGLHPGKSGNPAFSKYDLDSSLRTVFYTACAGFILLGYWYYHLRYRISKLVQDEE